MPFEATNLSKAPSCLGAAEVPNINAELCFLELPSIWADEQCTRYNTVEVEKDSK